uniref:Uncharacterized protein n=1 Tax=Anguilla anguilla TaxID=7936 RepID=A0A0E9Q4R9_ANGAN
MPNEASLLPCGQVINNFNRPISDTVGKLLQDIRLACSAPQDCAKNGSLITPHNLEVLKCVDKWVIVPIKKQ